MFIYFRDPNSIEPDDNYAMKNQNNFLVDLDLIQVKQLPYDFNGDKYEVSKYSTTEGGRRLIKMIALKNSVAQNIFTVPSEIVVHTAHYAKLESIESHADGANWKIGEKYVICENVLNDGGKAGHGLNGRSYAYCGSNYVTRQGRIGEGEGETFLFEPACRRTKPKLWRRFRRKFAHNHGKGAERKYFKRFFAALFKFVHAFHYRWQRRGAMALRQSHARRRVGRC